MDKIESFLTNAAQNLGELFESTAAASPAAAKPAAPAAPRDSVDHAAAEGHESSGVLRDDYQRFDTSGDRQLDDQLLLARTGGPAATASASKPSGPPQMTATGQYNAGDHNCYVLKFDRPVSRAEAERTIFKDGRTPDPKPPTYNSPDHVADNRVLLGSRDKTSDGRATEWVLSMPSNPDTSNYDSLSARTEAGILDAPPAPLPAWIPRSTRDVVATREIPQPGDRRFEQVRSGYPAPNDQVTTWRDGKTTFRYDARNGRIDGFADRPGAEMGGYNELRRKLVLEKGMSVDAATAETVRRYQEHFVEAVTDFIAHGV
jgi:hypothetical protein